MLRNCWLYSEAVEYPVVGFDEHAPTKSTHEKSKQKNSLIFLNAA